MIVKILKGINIGVVKDIDPFYAKQLIADGKVEQVSLQEKIEEVKPKSKSKKK